MAEQDFSTGFPSAEVQRLMAARYLSARDNGRDVSVSGKEATAFVERCQPWIRYS